MGFASINWWAVLVCLPISMVSGAIWYNPRTFFPIWWKGIGKTDETPGGGNMGLTWTLTVLSSLVQAIFMAFAVNIVGNALGGANLLTGLATGFGLWLGFIAPTYLVNKLFASHGLKVWAIEVGNHLLNFLLFGALLGLWR
jgi:hypothetical protein